MNSNLDKGKLVEEYFALIDIGIVNTAYSVLSEKYNIPEKDIKDLIDTEIDSQLSPEDKAWTARFDGGFQYGLVRHQEEFERAREQGAYWKRVRESRGKRRHQIAPYLPVDEDAYGFFEFGLTPLGDMPEGILEKLASSLNAQKELEKFKGMYGLE